MDLCVIVACLDRKRLSAREIQNHILAALEANIVEHNAVMRCLREVKFPLSNEETFDGSSPTCLQRPPAIA
jgi:hypothetical protein